MGPSCPECRNGKHDNCDEKTLDPETDKIVLCSCKAFDHKRPVVN